jgi:tetratricopeptide (TPR) repeat protein
VATRDAAAAPDAALAWALASRLVEEIDHYKEFRPVSQAGLLVARQEELGGTEVVPDEAQAARLARRLDADTVCALSAAAAPDGNLTIAVHVFDAGAPASGVSAPRDRIVRHELDGDGPARLAARLGQALERQWRTTLTDESAAPAAVPFDAYRAYVEADAYNNIGRYDLAEGLLRRAIESDPGNPLFHAALGCALSFQGKDEAAVAEASLGIAGLPKLTSRRERLVITYDNHYVESERAKRGGDRATAEREARVSLAAAIELAHVYREPLGYVYAATAQQYLLEDVAAGRKLYAEARRLMPSNYPAYYEDAKLVLGDGKSPEGRAEAARLLWQFIVCHPGTALEPYARADAEKWGLARPAGLACPGG